MGAPQSGTPRDRWAHALAAKHKHMTQPQVKQPRAGIGPNKASGHKGGIGRQGSKRG